MATAGTSTRQGLARWSGAMGRLFVLAAPVLIGCHSAPPAPETASGEYAGPPLALEADQGMHVVVASSPTPGWTVSVDRVDERFGYQIIFVSLRRPNPVAAYAQVVVEQRVVTELPAAVTVQVFARVLAYDAPMDSSAPYRRAGLPSDAR